MPGRAGPGGLPGAAVPPVGPRQCRVPFPGADGAHVHTSCHPIAGLHAHADVHLGFLLHTGAVAYTNVGAYTDVNTHLDAAAHADALSDMVRGLRQLGGAPRRALSPATGRAAGGGQLLHLPFARAVLGPEGTATPVHHPGVVLAPVSRPAHGDGYPGARRRHARPGPPRASPLPAASGSRRGRALHGQRPCGGCGVSGLRAGHGVGHDPGRQRPRCPRDPGPPLVR